MITSASKFWDEQKICRIIRADSNQIRDLAAVAGIPLSDIFKFSSISGLDLRNQDLSGIDISKINFEGAILDGSTKFSSEMRPITNRTKLRAQIEDSIVDAKPGLDIKAVTKQFLDAIYASVRVINIIGNYNQFNNIIESSDIELFKTNVVSSRRGYLKRDAAILKPSGDDIISSAIAEIINSFPGAYEKDFSSDYTVNQMELPFRDVPRRIRDRQEVSRQMSRILTNIRKYHRIVNVYAAIEYYAECHNLKSMRDQISQISRMKQALKFIMFTADRDLITSEWRKSYFSDADIRVIDLKLLSKDDVPSLLKTVELSSGGIVRFSSAFVREVAKFRMPWHHVRPDIMRCVMYALDHARTTPLKIGISTLRKAI
ncbi:hypothetical protein ACFSC3_03505 [Sphingomonas floccifaciens]|uniref:Pentapeptide repeat-containing protein n=1 Tax=Sphingomonas floccifaciens TaxID=1844115 RepID=A0ABW4N8Z9_9SPHN